MSSDQFARDVSRIALGHICLNFGWEVVSSAAMEILLDLHAHFAKSLGRRIQSYAESAGRTMGSLDDLLLAFEDQGVYLPELIEFSHHFEPCSNDLLKNIPVFPKLQTENNLNFLKPGSKEVLHRKIHVNEYLPPMFPELECVAEELKLCDIKVAETPCSSINGKSNDRHELEATRPLREICSVMMTSSGFLSPSRQGHMAVSRTPTVSDLPGVSEAVKKRVTFDIENEKCPTSIMDAKTVERLETSSPSIEPIVSKSVCSSNAKKLTIFQKRSTKNSFKKNIEIVNTVNLGSTIKPKENVIKNISAVAANTTSKLLTAKKRKNKEPSSIDHKPKIAATVRGRRKKKEIKSVEIVKEESFSSSSSPVSSPSSSSSSSHMVELLDSSSPPKKITLPKEEDRHPLETSTSSLLLHKNPLIPRHKEFGFGPDAIVPFGFPIPDKHVKNKIENTTSKRICSNSVKSNYGKKKKEKKEKLRDKRRKHRQLSTPPPLSDNNDDDFVDAKLRKFRIKDLSAASLRSSSPTEVKPDIPKLIFKKMPDTSSRRNKNVSKEKSFFSECENVQKLSTKDDIGSDLSSKVLTNPVAMSTRQQDNKHRSRKNAPKNVPLSCGSITTQTVGHYIDVDGNQIWICPSCGKQDDGSPMIGCDDCDDWYHWLCVGIKGDPGDDADWYCPRCKSKRSGNFLKTSSARKRKLKL